MTLCRHCLEPYEKNRVCSQQKKQDGNALCEPEKEREVSKGKMVKINLNLASFTIPEYEWEVTPRGAVVSSNQLFDGKVRVFDITREHDQKAVLAELHKHNWSIKETKRGGKPWYVALKLNNEPGKPRTEDGPGHSDKALLIAQIVQKITGERWE